MSLKYEKLIRKMTLAEKAIMMSGKNTWETVDFEKYGEITLTDKGMSEGKYLLYRHEILHHFLCVLNHSNDELEQVEKIEHFMDRKTILQIEKLTLFLENHHDYDQ